jgi:hypothetical protein
VGQVEEATEASATVQQLRQAVQTAALVAVEEVRQRVEMVDLAF